MVKWNKQLFFCEWKEEGEEWDGGKGKKNNLSDFLSVFLDISR